MWSAPVAPASSSTIAPTMASSETDRERPDRIRANDSASARRPISRAVTASRCRIAAMPTTSDEGREEPVERAGAVDHEARDEEETEEEDGPGEDPPGAADPRIEGSSVVRRAPGGFAHVGYRGWRSGTVASSPAGSTPGGPRTSTFVLSGPARTGSDRLGGRLGRRRGVVTAAALDLVEGLVRGGDQVGRVAAGGRERRHADRRRDRHGTALLPHERRGRGTRRGSGRPRCGRRPRRSRAG